MKLPIQVLSVGHSEIENQESLNHIFRIRTVINNLTRLQIHIKNVRQHRIPVITSMAL